jgi:hypothetical protein
MRLKVFAPRFRRAGEFVEGLQQTTPCEAHTSKVPTLVPKKRKPPRRGGSKA